MSDQNFLLPTRVYDQVQEGDLFFPINFLVNTTKKLKNLCFIKNASTNGATHQRISDVYLLSFKDWTEHLNDIECCLYDLTWTSRTLRVPLPRKCFLKHSAFPEKLNDIRNLEDQLDFIVDNVVVPRPLILLTKKRRSTRMWMTFLDALTGRTVKVRLHNNNTLPMVPESLVGAYRNRAKEVCDSLFSSLGKKE